MKSYGMRASSKVQVRIRGLIRSFGIREVARQLGVGFSSVATIGAGGNVPSAVLERVEKAVEQYGLSKKQ